MNAVAAGLRAEIDDRHADAGRRCVEDLVLFREADGHRVDQDVAVIAVMKPHRAANGRDAKGIAIAANAGDDAGHQMPGFRMFRRAERQRVQTGDRPRAHREHVAQNAADPRRRALIGLDVARMVVALHLEHTSQAIADIDDAGVLARPLDHMRTLGRQTAQMNLGGFIRAVLVPHRRKDAELGQGRLTPDQIEQTLVLVGLEAVFGDESGGDFDGSIHDSHATFSNASVNPANSPRPSVRPIAAST